jgi:histidine phosphotransferase ChpT
MKEVAALDLAAMMCSRLCHDMLSPIGALSNGLELLADETDPQMREKCVELLHQSAKVSADRLKFFRLAFGAAGGFGEMVPVEEPKSLIEALASNNPRIRLNWALAEARLPKAAVKVLLNYAQIAIDALVRGGTLDIGAESRDGASEIVVRATGEKVVFDEAIGLALEGELSPGDITSRTAAAYMLSLLSEDQGGSLQFRASRTALVLGAVMPTPEGMIG